jgi:hypothetical protein
MVRPAVTQCTNFVNMPDSRTLKGLRPANGPALYPGFCHQKPALGTMKFKSYKEGTESVPGLVRLISGFRLISVGLITGFYCIFKSKWQNRILVTTLATEIAALICQWYFQIKMQKKPTLGTTLATEDTALICEGYFQIKVTSYICKEQWRDNDNALSGMIRELWV